MTNVERENLGAALQGRADHYLRNLRSFGDQSKPTGNPNGYIGAVVPDWELRRLKAAIRLLSKSDVSEAV